MSCRETGPKLGERTSVHVVYSGSGVVLSAVSRSLTTTSTRYMPVNTATSRHVISAISRSTPSKLQTYTPVPRRFQLPEVGTRHSPEVITL